MAYTFKNCPPGWEIKKMPQVVKWGSGGTPKATVKEYYEGGTIPWLIIGDLNDGIVTSSASKITDLGLQNSSAKMIPEGTLLVAMYGSIGKLGITGMECCTNQAIAYAKELYGVTTKYMFYFMAMIKSELISMGKGGTQKNISQTVLNSLDVIVPPLDEQERIVTTIEELLSQLDEGVETLKKTQAQLEVYRQAVLKSAFDGTLTLTWRESHPNTNSDEMYDEICRAKQACGNNRTFDLVEEIDLPTLPESWRWIFVGDLSKGPEYGTSEKSLKSGKVPVVRMGNLQRGVIDWDDLVYTNNDDDIEKLRLKKGDILFNRTNSPELVGKTSIFRGECEAIFAGYLIRINQFDLINPEYLTYYMNSFIPKNYGNKVKTDGVNQSNINGQKLCSYPFPLCARAEQDAVVVELEERLSCCDSILNTVRQGLQQAEAMRQSILKQAFEGRL